jgi:hypothetical protein
MPLSDGLECYYRLGQAEQNEQEKMAYIEEHMAWTGPETVDSTPIRYRGFLVEITDAQFLKLWAAEKCRDYPFN